jgi:uncharacterized protein (TIGR02145 family)
MKEVTLFLLKNRDSAHISYYINYYYTYSMKPIVNRKILIFSLIGCMTIMYLSFILQSCKKLEFERVIRVKTGEVTDTTTNSASVTGIIQDVGENGITQCGHCWSISENPTLNDSHTTNISGSGSFTSNITGLSPETRYYVRAYATASKDTAYGNQISFITLEYIGPPTVVTSSISNITDSTVTCGGNVISDGGATVTVKGVCWSTSENPTVSDSHTTDGSGTGPFTSNLTGLSPGTTYYVRAYATNSTGTGYGTQRNFKTICSTVCDYDGNVYSTVQIGEQIWMTENLKTTHYSDGTSLIEGSGIGDITGDFTSKYWFVYDDNLAYKDTYGLLYTWAAVMNSENSSDASPSGVQGVCPTAWHVPSDSEWKELEIHLGMSEEQANAELWRGSNQGAMLKEGGSSGFEAILAGDRDNTGTFERLNTHALFWSSTENNYNIAWYRDLQIGINQVYRNADGKHFALSVRCIKDIY